MKNKILDHNGPEMRSTYKKMAETMNKEIRSFAKKNPHKKRLNIGVLSIDLDSFRKKK